MKLWIYWMDLTGTKHFEERELPNDNGNNQVDYEDACWKLAYKLNNGEIKDYQVEIRY